MSQHPCPWVAGKFLGLPACSSNRVEWHLTIKGLLSLRGAVTLSPSKADTSNTWFKSELQFLDAIQEISWSSAGTSLSKGQTSTLFIWLLRWLARLSGWRGFFGKGRMSGLMQLQGDWIGNSTGSLRSGQKAVAVTKQLGKLYCWRELMLSTKALHNSVPVKSNFALKNVCLRENLAKDREENGCKTFIPVFFSVCLFQHKFSPYARFPPERKTVCMHSLSSVVLVGIPLYMF